MERLKKLNETLVPILIAVALFWFSAPLFRSIDPTAALYDVGVLQLLFFGLLVMFVAGGSTWIFIRIILPVIYKFKDKGFAESFSKLDGYQKHNLVWKWFAVIFLGFILATRIL